MGQNFKGTKKQIEWANDIIERAKEKIEQDLSETESAKYLNPEHVENSRILADIMLNTLSDLSTVWAAGDVIENGTLLERNTLQALGIESYGRRSLKIKGKNYKYFDLKDAGMKKEFENEVLEHLKKKGGNK